MFLLTFLINFNFFTSCLQLSYQFIAYLKFLYHSVHLTNTLVLTRNLQDI